MNISKGFRKCIASTLLASCCVAPALAMDKVKFNLAWLPQGSTGGILVAIAKGFYAEAGLDVSAVRGYGGQRTVNEIDQGLFEFGYGDRSASCSTARRVARRSWSAPSIRAGRRPCAISKNRNANCKAG